MPTESSISARKLTAAQLEEKATALRLAGLSCAEIGRQLGVHESSAWRAIKRAKERAQKLATDTWEEMRRLEDDRLNTYLRGIMKQVMEGDVQAGNLAVRISESRRKLWGLDAPEKVDVTESGEIIVRKVAGLDGV